MARTTQGGRSQAPEVLTPPEPVSMRSDAKRNRAALVEAAGQAFSERGTDASLEDIARRAGVGIGTLYRHFPSRPELIEAVYRQQVESLCDGVDDLLAELSPDDALAEWMRRFVRYVALKRGLVQAMQNAVAADSEVYAYTHRLVVDTAGKLVSAAVEAGAIRPDADAEDVLRGVSGFCMASGQDGWQERALRLVSLLVDGLRHGRPAPTQGSRAPSRRKR